MQNHYNRRNRRKYNLKVHIVLVTKYRKALLQNGIDDFVKCATSYLAEQNDWKKHIFRSNGYFACSIGEVSSATIKKYIAEQG